MVQILKKKALFPTDFTLSKLMPTASRGLAQIHVWHESSLVEINGLTGLDRLDGLQIKIWPKLSCEQPVTDGSDFGLQPVHIVNSFISTKSDVCHTWNKAELWIVACISLDRVKTVGNRANAFSSQLIFTRTYKAKPITFYCVYCIV